MVVVLAFAVVLDCALAFKAIAIANTVRNNLKYFIAFYFKLNNSFANIYPFSISSKQKLIFFNKISNNVTFVFSLFI